MANFSIIHTTTKSDYSGSGAVAGNMELIASDWNATHFTLSAGQGLTIISDGANPPTLTFSIGGGGAAGTTSFAGHLLPAIDATYDIGSTLFRWRTGYFTGTLSAGSGFQTSSPGAISLNGAWQTTSDNSQFI